MSMQGFRGNCDSKGKLGMCPSLAEPDSGGIPRRELLLEKTVFPVRQKGIPPLLLLAACLRNTIRIWFGKAGAHPQLALEIAIAPETLSLIATFHF